MDEAPGVHEVEGAEDLSEDGPQPGQPLRAVELEGQSRRGRLRLRLLARGQVHRVGGSARRSHEPEPSSVSGSSMRSAKARMSSTPAPGGRATIGLHVGVGLRLAQPGLHVEDQARGSLGHGRGAVGAGELEDGAARQRGQVGPEVEPLDQLHGEPGVALGLAGVEDAHDVGVLERPQHLELAGEPAGRGGVHGGCRSELHRGRHAVEEVAGTVDRSHSPPADDREESPMDLRTAGARGKG